MSRLASPFALEDALYRSRSPPDGTEKPMIDHIDHIVLTTRERKAASGSIPRCSG
jgi:hypothetical protein